VFVIGEKLPHVSTMMPNGSC